MTRSVTYEPKQKRSIEKKNHIIDVGLQLMMKQGYYHTTTDDIANAAGVSTGIIYRYFTDKHDLLLCGLNFYVTKLEEEDYLDIPDKSPEGIQHFVTKLIDKFLNYHLKYAGVHEELETMRHSDADVGALYKRAESSIIARIAASLQKSGDSHTDLTERIYAVFHLMEGFCHMSMQTDLPHVNMEQMKQIIIRTSCDLLYTS